MKHKALRGRAFVKDATQGIAEVVVSAYGNVDHDKDIVVKGSVAKQIAGEYGPNPKGLLDHDWSMRSAVAKTLRMWEEDDGTHIEAQYNLEKAIAREAFSDLQFYGDDMEFSVGYEVKSSRRPDDAEKELGAKQVITEWQINEWSHVMLGANSQTGLVAAKARTHTDAGAKAVEAKALVGSLEYHTERLTEALSEAFPSDWLWVRGTYPDRVVFAREWRSDDTWEYATFEVGYTETDGAFDFAEPVEVRTAEVVEVKAAEATPPLPAEVSTAKARRQYALLIATT